MNKLLLVLFVLFSVKVSGQTDTSKIIRAFPITGYITDLSDGIKIVQVHLPQGEKITDKQTGLLKGMYRDKHADTASIGAGRCHLIKGNYYYFTINFKESGILPREGDLLYTFMPRTGVYQGNIVKLAAWFIGLQNVYEKPLYDRYAVFSRWTISDEDALIDSAIADIHFTGDYFLQNNPAMNVKIKSGKNEGKPVLNTMMACGRKDIIDFFEYMIARPRLYSGHEWKVSEVFATWLSEGAPTVVKE